MQGPVLVMVTLLAKIQGDLGRLATGSTDPPEAWERLNKGYGDEQLAVIATMKDLMQLKMPA